MESDLARKTTRREWLKQAGATSGLVVMPKMIATSNYAAKTILLVSSWQSVNIGDVTHTTGMLNLLRRYLPEAKVILWPNELGNGAESLLRERFPDLRIVFSILNPSGAPYAPEVLEAFDEADFLLHSSGASLVARDKVQSWHKLTGKPFGVFGITLSEITNELTELLPEAAFVFTRETHSLQNMQQAGVTGPGLDFVPDVTFAVTERDTQKAEAFLTRHNLQQDAFICVIPRLRYTPYHRIRAVDWNDERIEMVERVNAEAAERDHAKFREVMVAWVRETGNKILLCPEMTYQLDIMKPLLFDPLPEDVKEHVVRRQTFWRPDEAASVYEQARAVISMECHSPIIAMTAGTPAFYVRQPEDTIKGQMYYDLGRSDWVFEIEETKGQDLVTSLMEVHHNYPTAVQKVKHTLQRTQQLHENGMATLRRSVP